MRYRAGRDAHGRSERTACARAPAKTLPPDVTMPKTPQPQLFEQLGRHEVDLAEIRRLRILPSEISMADVGAHMGVEKPWTGTDATAWTVPSIGLLGFREAKPTSGAVIRDPGSCVLERPQ